MTVPGVRISSSWTAAPPPESESESESTDMAAAGRLAAACGLRTVMGIVR